MADTTALKNRIRAAIKANDNQEITGPVLQQSLLDIVDELNGATETEASARQSGDSTLQQGINTERQARIDADSALGQRITQETQRAQEAEQTIDGKASKALHNIENLEIEDVTGSQVQVDELSIALRTNEGSAEDPEIVTLDTLTLPSATPEKAGLLNAQHKKELCSIKGPNAFVSKATFTSGKEWPRANANTNNMSVTAIIVFAYFDGILDYGIMDHTNNNSITKIGELSLHEGWNFLNLDSSVATGQNEYLYVQQNANDSRNRILAGRQASVSSSPDIKAVGIYQGAPDVGSYVDFELCYYCVEDIYTGKAFFEALQQHDRQIVKLLEEDNKNLKLTSEYITTNNRAEDISKYNTINGIRANKFEGDIRGIRVYATVAGIIQYGILEGNNVQLLGTQSVTTGWNTILFNSTIACNSGKHIYIKPTTAQIKATNENGVGMYEKGDGSSTVFFEGWEIAYHAILSIGIDAYISDLESQISSDISTLEQEIKSNTDLIKYIKGPNSILSEQYSFVSSSTWPRANANTNNSIIKALIIWAEGSGVVDYGKIDTANDYATTKIGELSLTSGWNYIVLENTITTGNTEYLYLQPQVGENVVLRGYQDNDSSTTSNTKAVGLIQGAPNKLYSTHHELRYYIIGDTIANSLPMYIPELYNWNMALQKRIDDNLPPLVSEYMNPTTELSEITQYANASYFRANKFVPTKSVKGIRLCLQGFTTRKDIEICTINSSTKVITPIKTVTATQDGTFDFLFDLPVTLASNEYLGVRGPGAGLLHIHNEEGSVGMVEYNDVPSYVDYPTWEMSYSLILQQGCNIINEFNNINKRIDDLEPVSYIDLKYGEILLPNEIEVARSRQCNLWWDCIANYLIGDKSIYFETHCNIGHNLERGYRIEGSEQAAGNYTLRIVSRKSTTREIIDDKTVTIHVVNDTTGSGSKQILMIGDSRTWHSVATEQGVSYNIEDQGGNKTITTEVKRLVDANTGAVFTFLGTFTSQLDPTVKNLATSGATYSWANSQIGNSIVDFVENQCSGTGLDYVTIMYGINDIEDWNNNQIGQYERSKAKITSVLNNAKALVDKILAGYPNCKIIMVVEPTTCGDQDGFGTWGQTDRDQHLEIEFAQKYLRKKFLEIFDAHEYGNNVYVSSAGIWCDRLYGFPYTKQLQSSRASEKIVEYFRNSVHPHDDGYKQIADGIYSTIKYLESL